MSGGKFDPAAFETVKPWQPTPTPWAAWPVDKEPTPPSARTGRLAVAAVAVVLLLLACVWPPAAGILGVFLTVAFMAGR